MNKVSDINHLISTCDKELLNIFNRISTYNVSIVVYRRVDICNAPKFINGHITNTIETTYKISDAYSYYTDRNGYVNIPEEVMEVSKMLYIVNKYASIFDIQETHINCNVSGLQTPAKIYKINRDAAAIISIHLL